MDLEEWARQVFENPAHLFFSLWQLASGLNTFQRTTSDPCADLVLAFDKSLSTESTEVAVRGIVDTILSAKNDVRSRKHGTVLCAMRCIDQKFLTIHPRSQCTIHKGIEVESPVDWLCDLAETRALAGSYYSVGGMHLISRGPLTRQARAQFAGGGERLQDYFSALAVVPSTYRNNESQIRVRHAVLASGGISGVAKAENLGSERVAFAPVARKNEDLRIVQSEVGGQGFIEVEMTVDAASILTNVIREVGSVDLLIAPEMTVNQASAENIAENIRAGTFPSPRMAVVGSGNSSEISGDGLCWNQASILNQFGVILWQQRKVWTSGFNSTRAAEYGLTCPDGKFLLEKNAESTEVVIADIDGLGRCVVLICQDLESKPLAADLLLDYQPDWVLVPILDQGITPGRWAHQRAFELSANSSARFLVASSLSLVPEGCSTIPPCGFAIGPKAMSDDGRDSDRTFKAAIVDPKGAREFVTIQWRNGDWEQTVMNAQSSKE